MGTLFKIQCGFLLFSCFSILFQSLASATLTVPLRSKKAMVVSASPIASQVGKSILAKGGNAVDAVCSDNFGYFGCGAFFCGNRWWRISVDVFR